jgi:hypothetical protein
MTENMFSNSKKTGKKATKVEVNHNMKDYGKEPFFVQKAEASKKVIEKYGIPKSLATGKK